MNNSNEYNPQDIIAAFIGVDKLTNNQVNTWNAKGKAWASNPNSSYADPVHTAVMMAAAALK